MVFVADSMLGKLAKWLRVLGYDTHYESQYRNAALEQSIRQGRLLLTRHRPTADHYGQAVLLFADRVGEQLAELRDKAALAPDRAERFSRCLICNERLSEAETADARESVPEYVFYENAVLIRHCASCGRYYWPGTHRKRMESQLEQWGF